MKSNTIRIKNELPELLEAVCTHPDCPEWLLDELWEAFNNRGQHLTWSAAYWRSTLEAVGETLGRNDHSPDRTRELELEATIQ